MKSVSLVFLVVLFASCNSGKPTLPPKADSLTVLYRVHRGLLKGPLQAATARYTPVLKRVFSDSASTSGKWVVDSSWEIQIPADTMRDIKRKPIYDSAAKAYKFNMMWRAVQPSDSVSIQIVTI